MSRPRGSAPRWARALLARLAGRGRSDEVVGDLEEAHRARRARHGPVWAALLTSVEALDMAVALLRARRPSLSWLDVKLGLRMMVKHPGLTVVAVLAIAFGVGVGAVALQVVTDTFQPALGLDESDRVVELEQGEDRRVLHDFVTWREALESVEDLGAWSTVRRTLSVEGGGARPVRIAEISASAFRMARVPPLLGRTLVEADEAPGPGVLVLGYDVWRTQLDGDPDVVGRTVGLGATTATVVGVMPEDFAFPMSHDAWSPLRVSVLDHERGEGPELDVFGRLAPGVSLAEAQAELTVLGQRVAAAFPETNARLRPVVRPYRGGIVHGPELLLTGTFATMVVLPVLVLLLVCANVALMVFARTAAREGELVVRSALGASRARVVLQLFVEALVLAGSAAAVGLVAADVALGHLITLVDSEMGGSLPYWFHDGLTPTTVLWGALLTLVGAIVVGVVPALRVTGGGLRPRLAGASAGGGGQRMGGLWTVVIAVQVAVTIALVPFVGFALRTAAPALWNDTGFPAGEYLAVSLEADPGAASTGGSEEAWAERARAFHGWSAELKERLASEPGVRGVAAASHLPGSPPPLRRVEAEGGSPPTGSPYSAAVSVDDDYFDVLGAPLLAGRGFEPDDVGSGPVAIVNEAFARVVLGGRNPIGRRVRFPRPVRPEDPVPAEPPPWYEIVGLVRDAEARIGLDAADEHEQMLYLPLEPGGHAVEMIVRAGGDPASLAPRVRALAAAVDPSLQVAALRPLDEVVAAGVQFIRIGLWTIIAAAGLALLLSNAGIYSALSFAVSRRTREIGVRVALGASRRRVLASVLGHALVQITVGVVAGGVLLAAIVVFLRGEELLLWSDGASATVGEAVATVAAYGGIVLGIGMLACVVPTRRALRIQPAEALVSDG